MQEWKEKIRIVRGRLAWASLPLCFCGLVLFDAALRFFYRAAGSPRFLDLRGFVVIFCVLEYDSDTQTGW